MRQRKAICATCDAWCGVLAEVDDDGRVRVKARDPRPLHADICMKGVHAPSSFAHPDRVLYPLRRVGERGSGRWEQVTWDAALDDIAARLGSVIERFGPEGFAVSSSPWNITADNGASAGS